MNFSYIALVLVLLSMIPVVAGAHYMVEPLKEIIASRSTGQKTQDVRKLQQAITTTQGTLFHPAADNSQQTGTEGDDNQPNPDTT